MAASTLACRDFNLVLVSNPIAWSYHLTCKPTAAASCKTSVDEFANLWIKVRKDEDKFCADLYKGTQIMANSCNLKLWIIQSVCHERILYMMFVFMVCTKIKYLFYFIYEIFLLLKTPILLY